MVTSRHVSAEASAIAAPLEAPIGDNVRKAANAWAASVFTAPSRFDELITCMTVRDEPIRRIATRLICRTLKEQRGPAPAQRTACRNEVSPRHAAEQLDPFEHTVDSMRAATEHVGACSSCTGTGRAACSDCKGSGRTRCSNCWGSGKQRSEKTGRPIQCKICKASGKVGCGRCGAAGLITCGGCVGSGQELVWTTFVESTRWDVVLEPDAEVAKAYPLLREGKALEEESPRGLVRVHGLEAAGPLSPQQLAALPPTERNFIESRVRVHPRFERVAFQQALRLDVVRRELEFEMCGTRGHLVLAGEQMVGARTEAALHPIHRRLLWLVCSIPLLFIATAIQRAALIGESRYFDELRGPMSVLWLLAVGAAIPALAGVLRSWRGRLAAWPLRPMDKIFGAVAVASWLGLGVLGFAGQPSIGEARSALAAGDAARAHEIVDALKERRGAALELLALEDAVLLLEAERAAGAERLALLEAVIARRGGQAEEALRRLHAAREQELRRLLAIDPQQALDAAKRWYPAEVDRSPEVRAAMADAADAVAAACAELPCELAARRASSQHQPTPTRQAALETTRQALRGALEIAPELRRGPLVLEQLVALRVVDRLAEQTLVVVLPEDELGQLAAAARAQVAARLGSVALIGARRELVQELLGSLDTTSDPAGAAIGDTAGDATHELITHAQVEGVSVYAAFDRQGSCRGLYVTNRNGARVVSSTLAERLLSQAVGRATAIRLPQGAKVKALRWSVGNVPIVARGELGQIFELRIGAATP